MEFLWLGVRKMFLKKRLLTTSSGIIIGKNLAVITQNDTCRSLASRANLTLLQLYVPPVLRIKRKSKQANDSKTATTSTHP